MDIAKIFKNGESQAIRIPKAYRLEGSEALITKMGETLLIFPKKEGWDSLIASLDKFTDDFMSERVQPELENRESIF